VDELGRLLERLQERVLALVGHRVGALDDEHSPRALERPVGGGDDHALAHLVDQVLRPPRSQPYEVGVRRGIGQRAAAGVVGVLGALSQELRREGARGSPLSRARRPGEQVGVDRRGKRGAERRPSRGLLLGGVTKGFG
jgi:hypothetical protein